MSSSDFSDSDEEELTKEQLDALTIVPNCTKVQKARFGGKKLTNGFEMMGTLGMGGFATVKLCKFRPTGAVYALKKMRKPWLRKKREWSRKDGKMVFHTMLDKVMSGVEILKMMAHPNVVKLHSVMNDPEDDNLYLVIDYCERKQVMDWNSDKLEYESTIFAKGTLGGIEPGAVAHVAMQAAKGIEYIHKMGVVHRDIKPDNLLVTKDWVVKVADFGVSKKIDQKTDGGLLKDTAGTYPFMSPQIANGDSYEGKMADVWALGITVFALTFATVPYYNTAHAQLFELIKTEPVKFPKEVDDLSKDFMLSMLEKDTKKRITLDKLQQHKWILEALAKGFKKEAEPQPNSSSSEKKEGGGSSEQPAGEGQQQLPEKKDKDQE